MTLTRHLVIAGKVQGVWYRESMRIEAERLGVTGWVRNRRDGAVEAMVQGEEAAVLALIAWTRRGPTAAEVERVEIGEGSGDYATFERLPSV